MKDKCRVNNSLLQTNLKFNHKSVHIAVSRQVLCVDQWQENTIWTEEHSYTVLCSVCHHIYDVD